MIETFYKTRTGVQDLPSKLLLANGEVGPSGTKYNVPLINTVVFSIGMAALQAQGKAAAQCNNVQMDLLSYLLKELDPEGCYLLLSSIVNQLRFPNSHTYLFSSILLHMFADSSQQVQEQITRVLLERLIVNRPHPWGLLITFIELIKNPRYQFWQISSVWRSSTRDIESLFDSISRIMS
jgi:CCR4-NOT transcription complex subunit 1